ncbi:MAG: glutathione peroxidase [Parvibaculaceae bacterium]
MADAYDFAFTRITGERLALADFAGKAVLVVNTASACGYTPQYEELEALWQAYKDKGLVVLGVPCNQFGGQEPGSEAEIGAFCRKAYGVTFPLTAKTEVKGKDAHPFYRWANAAAGPEGQPKWNFHKYLVGRDGSLSAWFSSRTKPTGPKIRKALEKIIS